MGARLSGGLYATDAINLGSKGVAIVSSTEYARVVGGTVFELFTPPTGVSLSECFTADVAAQFVAVPAGQTPAQGWIYSGGTFAAPVVPMPPLAQQAAAALGAGVTLTVSGTMTLAATLFPTDPVTTAKIGAVVTTLLATSAFPGGATSYPMKDAAGAWHTFTTAQYPKVAGAIAAYVAALDLIADGNPLSATALPSPNLSVTV